MTPPPKSDACADTSERRFDLVVFDWDGTLFDSTALIARCIQLAVADVGGRVPADKDAAYVIGMGLMQALAYAAPDVPIQRHPDLLERYRHHYLGQQDELSLFAGVMPLLHDLKTRQQRLAIATGKSRRGLDQVLHRVELRKLFDSTRTADETAGKPDPLMLHQLMEELGVEPARTLMVGDTTHDLQMALNAGCPSVGVSYGAHDARDFALLRPLLVAHSVAELHHWMLHHG